MRSVSRDRLKQRLRACGAPVLAAAVAAGLTGCATTMQTAARLQLNDARIRASADAVRLSRTAKSTRVSVERLALVAAHGRTAYVVTVRNASTAAVTDLPISIGYTAAHRRPVYLNASTNLSYFAAHLPVIAATRQLTWVYAGAPTLPAGARPFAVIGTTSDPPVGRISLPLIAASIARTPFAGARLVVRLRNLSGIPQYQLPIYVLGLRGGRAVAAGTTSVPTLDGGSEETVRLRMLGKPDGARLTVEAPPTIFN